MCKVAIAQLFFVLTIACAYAQDKQLEKRLDSLLAERFSKTGPGCVALVAKHGNIIYHKAIGSANLELSVPLEPEMVFDLASITKQFTAVAVLKLAEQGKISLQDSIQTYIKDFPSKPYRITIENLLTHTSGLKDYLQVDNDKPYAERWDYTPKQLIELFKKLPLEFEPGSRHKYSNSGYALLGAIIEAVSGKSYQTYIKEEILVPLKLHNTYFDIDNAIIPKRVAGYYKSSEGFKNREFWSPTIAYAAGGLLSNAMDLFKWNRALLANKILKKETLDKAFTPFKLNDGTVTNYGYGWNINLSNGIRSIEHSGAKNGFLTSEIYYPDQDIFIVLLCNSEDAPRDELVISIPGLVLGIPIQKDVKVPDIVLNSYLGTYSLMSDPKRQIVIVKGKGGLVAEISGQKTYPLVFQSDTSFQFKNIRDAVCEFRKEKGKVSGLVIKQSGRFEWKKIN
jgi:CubicO group peptidase (beta-lactamase class C family)